MQRLARSKPRINKMLSQVKRHVQLLARNGHEIALHVHPHWEETTWRNDVWVFSGTRYQLRDFSDDEISEIFVSYTNILRDLTEGGIHSYRAGGFCIEPFDRIRNVLTGLELLIDSSVVPGAVLKDDDKGFDFSAAPDAGWWRFDKSPLIPDANGRFIEIPITPQKLPLTHYWGRLFAKISGREPPETIGDGRAKRIGNAEILRRLAGTSRVAELSIDSPKVAQLLASRQRRRQRDVWQIMGHPKLLSRASLVYLAKFMEQKRIRRTETLSGLGAAIQSGELSPD